MKTAAEFVRSLADGVYIADILARDIEVLEEAAKKVCVPCSDGRHPTLDRYGRRWHSGADCKAWGIHDLIAELKKGPADGT